jgi:hypothetical protein
MGSWVQFLAPFVRSSIKILFLTWLLMIIVASPAAYAYFSDDVNSWLRSKIQSEVVDILVNYRLPIRITCFAMSGQFGIGALWGLVYVKRKLRQRKAAIAAKRAALAPLLIQSARSGVAS